MQEIKAKKSLQDTQMEIFKLEARIEVLEKLIGVNKNDPFNPLMRGTIGRGVIMKTRTIRIKRG